VTAITAASILSAIRYLHKNGIVIRRLRPENIFFSERDAYNEPRLCDLMFANYLSELDNEVDYAIEKAMHPPKDQFQGDVWF